MKKRLFASLMAVTISASLATPALAVVDEDWNYSSNHEYGKYVPPSGSISGRVGYQTGYDDIMTTEVEFTFDERSVEAIAAYNSGNGEHADAKGKNCYLTLDVTCVGDGTLDPFSAYAVYTDLPDPKIDMEDDDLLGNRKEESEVTALGVIEEETYYMRTVWDDYRTGDDTGEFQAQFSMSKKGVIDYNNVVQSSVIQAILGFGGTAGEYSLGDSYSTVGIANELETYTESIAATVTFSEKLSAVELATYCAEHNIVLERVQARGIDSTGKRVTFDSLVTKGIEETEKLLKTIAANEEIEFKGFVSAYAYVNPETLSTMQNDDLTYCVESVESNFTKATITDSNVYTVSFPHSMAWQLENMTDSFC